MWETWKFEINIINNRFLNTFGDLFGDGYKVSKATINHPYVDGLYNPSMVNMM